MKIEKLDRCEKCGGYLYPGERCDCEDEEEEKESIKEEGLSQYEMYLRRRKEKKIG